MPSQISGRSLSEWYEFAKTDTCLDQMVPSELRQILRSFEIRIGMEIEKAAGELPDGYEIRIAVEAGGHSVRLNDGQGCTYFSDGDSIGSQISELIEVAKQGKYPTGETEIR